MGEREPGPRGEPIKDARARGVGLGGHPRETRAGLPPSARKPQAARPEPRDARFA